MAYADVYDTVLAALTTAAAASTDGSITIPIDPTQIRYFGALDLEFRTTNIIYESTIDYQDSSYMAYLTPAYMRAHNI